MDTLAPVWLSSPQEGDHVGRRFGVQVVGAVPGAAASLVIWDGSGAVVFQRTVQLNADAPARGEARLTLSLPPGEYRIEAYYVADDGSPRHRTTTWSPSTDASDAPGEPRWAGVAKAHRRLTTGRQTQPLFGRGRSTGRGLPLGRHAADQRVADLGEQQDLLRRRLRLRARPACGVRRACSSGSTTRK